MTEQSPASVPVSDGSESARNVGLSSGLRDGSVGLTPPRCDEGCAPSDPSGADRAVPPTIRSLDGRLNDLLTWIGRQETAIYNGRGVPAAEVFDFLDRVGRIVEALCAVTSVDTYHDVLELIEDAV